MPMTALILDREISKNQLSEKLRIDYYMDSDIVNTIDDFKSRLQEKAYDMFVLEPAVLLDAEPDLEPAAVIPKFQKLLLDELILEFAKPILIITIIRESLSNLISAKHTHVLYRQPPIENPIC